MDCEAKTCNIPTSADISVNSIFLYDIKSKEKIIGNENKFFDRSNSFPSLKLASAEGGQNLKLISHFGGIGEIAEFEISYPKKDRLNISKLKQIKKFVSGKGIQLGMSKARLISILGKPSKVMTASNSVTFIYRIEDFEGKNDFLSCYNMPIYFGNYLFKNNKLFKFNFGFEYP